jgi:hypothetical protein
MHQIPIIPVHQQFYGVSKTLDLQAICIFAATGFFLDQDTYYKEQKVLKPAHTYILDDGNNTILKEEPWFKWNYNPRDVSLTQIVNEFADLFHQIVNEQVGDKTVILPLSGGLDSRTQAAALWLLNKKVHAYSYSFQDGHDEAQYGEQIAKACSYPFENWKINSGYLWDCIEQLGNINLCYSEFTHPRQMAFWKRYPDLGEVFSLGHWGDVLFDDMGVEDDLPLEQQVRVVLKKIVKKGGIELGRSMWQAWELNGNFDEYLLERVRTLLSSIDIPTSANARIRAFKSLYWAPRWTSINLSVYESVKPVTLPYYDDRMCQFICSIPEKYLAKRKIQIEYLKLRAPKLASIPWQSHRPFNLNNYKWDKAPYNLPYRIGNKARRLVFGNYTQRNWELQFSGSHNQKTLERYLFESSAFASFISNDLVKRFYEDFRKNDAVKYSHSISMLLTLSVFAQTQLKSFSK